MDVIEIFGIQMHGYHISQKLLLETLVRFKNCQLQIITRSGEALQGEIESYETPKGTKGTIRVFFRWLCTKRPVIEDNDTPRPRWFIINPPSPKFRHKFHFVDLHYSWYYFQEDEGRLKIKTKMGEICHILPANDHVNLVKVKAEDEEDFLPFCQSEEKIELTYKKFIFIALMARRK